MNAAKDFSVSDPGIFKQKVFHWAGRNKHACYLDSNDYQESWSSFDCLAGAGALSVLQPAENCFGALNAFMDRHRGWLLGFLGYDLKNETEALSSGNDDRLGFPSLYFFIPQDLILLKGSNVQIISGRNPASVFREIMDFPLPGTAALTHSISPVRQDISREEYLETVEAIRRHIKEGDVYEMNFCLNFYASDTRCSPADLFRELNALAPAPFASFLKFEEYYILCASPERFLKKTGRNILSQPVKGTIRRSSLPAEDEQLKSALRGSEKEQAENVMIVDLVRNDLSRSAVPGSVKVSELFGIYTFRHWHQMISTVKAEAKPGIHPLDIVRNAFPMGSMTGAPKIMAMKLIEQYERTRRGAFSGAIGYFTPDGDFDFNVVIRSILYNSRKKHLSFSVGSAITYDSVPENEYEECLLKAKAIRSLFKSVS